MTSKHAPAGFTLMEVLVAFTVMSLMMFLINKIFFETSRTISHGVSMQKTLASGSMIAEQITSDAQYMVGADMAGTSKAGFLMIVNEEISAPRLVPDLDPLVNSTIRSDQLVFIYDNTIGGGSDKRREVLCPKTTSTLWSDEDTSKYIRLWYGHVRRTKPDGTDASGDLGAGDTGNPNYLALHWILGRQALFLNEAVLAATIHAEGTGDATWDADVIGYGGGTGVPPAPMTRKLYMGLTDVGQQDLNDLVTQLALAAKYPDGALLYGFATQRLRANPNPVFSTAAPYDYAYATWQVA